MPRTDFPFRIAVTVAGLLLAGHGMSATPDLPATFDKARYEALRSHSPFSLATITAPEPAPQAGFAANWYVSGIARIGDTDFVTIKSRDQTKEFSLYGRAENESHVALMSVNWSDAVGKSTVVIRQGTETARLQFNEAEVRSTPPQPLAAANGAAMGGNAAAAGVAPKPIGIPGVSGAAAGAGAPVGVQSGVGLPAGLGPNTPAGNPAGAAPTYTPIPLTPYGATIRRRPAPIQAPQ